MPDESEAWGLLSLLLHCEAREPARRSADGERLWLSVLIDTMERVSQPERRTAACDPSLLAKVRAQLQRPASTYRSGVSYFSPPELDRRL